MNYSIVKETNDWLVINKPAGESVHIEKTDEGTTELGVVAQLKKDKRLMFLAPVHRLDKVTSGCLLLAKNSQAAAELANQFSQRQVDKFYLAITKGKPKKKQGSIIGDMQPARNGNWKLTKTSENPAITQFFSHGFQDGLRLSVINILTGKTHQIRVALKSNGSPVFGDSRYSAMTENSIDRCYLHCWQMNFHYQQQAISVICLPEQGELFLTEAFTHHKSLHQSPEQLPWPKTPK